MENPQVRIDKLVRLVKYYDYMLHVKGKVLIDDEIYDAMRRELEYLESIHPEFAREDSPSNYIGIVSSSCNKTIERSTPMLSLKHTYNKNDIYNFAEDFFKINETIVVEPKIDGVAVCLIYIDGILDSISLRGDGKTGEDITHFAPFVENIPLKIDNYSCEIRGEIITNKNFIKENNRNYVAGCLRRKNSDFFNLKFFPYKLIYSEVKTQVDSFKWLGQYMEIPIYFQVCNSMQMDIKINEILSMDFEFFIDGVVLKLNNIELNLGITNRYPRDALAYKFSNKNETTKIIGIEWNINRTGKLTPTCLLKPIKIDGSNISKVSGHNKRYIKSNNIGENTRVVISRVGDVIPQIATILESSSFKPIEKCPFCGGEIFEDDINYLCINDNCKEKNVQKIQYFFQKIGVEGLSFHIINKFINNKIDTIVKILETLNTDSWIIDKNDLNVYYQWQKIKQNISVKQILIALGIENISDVYIKNLDINTVEDLRKISLKDGKKAEIFITFIQQHYENIVNIMKIIA